MSVSASPLPRRTVLELYCEQNGIASDAFDRHLLRRALYPHARLLEPLIRLLSPEHFVADYDYIHAVALIRRMRDISVEADAFANHPANIGPLRSVLRLRISSTRLQKIIHAVLHPRPQEIAPDRPA